MNKKIVIYVVIILMIAAAAAFYFSRSSQYSPTPATQTSVTPPAAAPTAIIPPPTAALPSNTKNIGTAANPATTAVPPPTPAAIPTKTYNVTVINFSFNPGVLTINRGDTVIWTNQDSVPHQIAGGSFNGPVISKNQSYTFLFNNTGTFDYHCAIHPSMKGTIAVK